MQTSDSTLGSNPKGTIAFFATLSWEGTQTQKFRCLALNVLFIAKSNHFDYFHFHFYQNIFV